MMSDTKTTEKKGRGRPPGKISQGMLDDLKSIKTQIAEVWEEVAQFSKRQTGVLAILKQVVDNQARLQEQLDAIDNDVQDILEVANRSEASQTLPSSLPLKTPAHTKDAAPQATQAGSPLPQAVTLDFSSHRQPAPQGRPTAQPKVPVPKVPESTMKMEFQGDQSAFADAMNFQDNGL